MDSIARIAAWQGKSVLVVVDKVPLPFAWVMGENHPRVGTDRKGFNI